MSIHTLVPTYHDRIWGGRNIQTVLGRSLPGDRIGEAWELCDRPETQTLIGPDNRTLHQLWTSSNRATFFGRKAPDTERFPILIKILDACDKLSLQVHPPEKRAAAMNGEPKTELWYFLETQPDAEILVGLKQGVTRAAFEKAITDKTLVDCFHRIPTAPGEVMFLPSGRVHAIGAGNLILEIQQNSDTTYRVYDFDRIDAKTGKTRELHIEQSLQCINFNDIEPIFTQTQGNRILDCKYFAIHRHLYFEKEARPIGTSGDSFLYLFIARGRFKIQDREYPRGTSLMVGAETGEIDVECLDDEGHLITVGWPD